MNIIDSHTHVMRGHPCELLSMARSYQYESFCALSIPCNGLPLNNLECLLLKHYASGKCYVYGGITYCGAEAPAPTEAEKELELLMEAGCDGWKLLESKPSIYRKLRLPLNGGQFASCFSFAEENGIPIIWHSGDPASFWSEETAPDFAVENHWLCVGEGYPSLEEMDGQIEQVLKAHPKLQVTLAHLFFTSDRRELGRRMLNTYPNLWFDITPGSEMYLEFLRDTPYWRQFFEQYQDRLVYGTDMADYSGDVVFGSQKEIVNMIMRTITEDRSYSVLGVSGQGLGLPEAIQRKLFRDNFRKRNPAPKALNKAGVTCYGDWLLRRLPKELIPKCEALLGQF